MRLFNKLFATSIVVFLLLNSFNSAAQCKRYTKKNCLPSLSPYLHNGQLTSTYMIPGDSAEVLMTFNAGKEYRILICSQELIGKVQFKVMDKRRKVLYTSDEEASNPSWDFKVENTQQFIIQIMIPKKEKSIKKNNMVANGCVALLIGFKE
jgi:hypothetical protein